MSAPDDQVDVSRLLGRYPAEAGQSVLMPLLQEIQEDLGYLPVPALERVSEHLRVPLAHIHGVVSFYAQFSLVPRGRHVVKMCMGTACHVRGGQAVRDEIVSYLGVGDKETTPDRAFTLEIVRCLGTCFLAPVMMIGTKYYGALTPSKTRRILAGYRDGSTPS